MNLNGFNAINIRKKIIAGVTLFLFFCAGLIYLVLIPAVNNIKYLRTSIISQKAELEKKIVAEKNIQSLNEKLNKIEPQMEKIDQIFINQNRELEFITTLETIAQQNNITQEINLNPNSAQNEQGYKKIPLELNAAGEFYDLMKYLTDLESLNYYVNIKSIDLSANPSAENYRSRDSRPKKKPNDSDTVSLKIFADTYWK